MSYFTKSKTAKIVAGVVGFTMALSLFVGIGATSANAQGVSLSQLVELFISLGIISSDKAAQARAAVSGYTTTSSFTLDLKVGSRGTEVTNLQKSLNTDSRTQVASSGAGSPGNESSYFGALTKSAVMKYQIIKGISATGMVDAATRASLNAVSASSASSVSSVASSAASSVASSVSTVGGTEGLITTKLSATPADNANVRTSTNYSAYGIEVKAIGSDMTVDRADLQVAVTVSGTAQNPSSFITGISAYDGDTLLVSKSLSSSDFNKDSSDLYHIIISGMNFKVSKDATKTLTFKVNTASISSSDTARVMTIRGYTGNSQNIRAYDTLGLQSYTDMSAAANVRTHTFNSAGASTLTTSANVASTPKSNNSKVSSTDGVQNLTMQAIDFKATTGNATITTVKVTVRATTTTGMPSTLELLDGSTVLGSQTVSDTSSDASEKITFSGLTVAVAKDATKTLTVRATFPTTVSGQAASTSIAATAADVVYEKPDGSTGNAGPSSVIAGNDQYMYSAVPKWSLVSASANGTAGVVGVASSSVTATIVLKAKADGGSMTKPTAGNFTFVFASTTAANGAYTAANSISVTPTIQTSPTDSSVGDAGEYTVTLTGVIYSNNSSLGSSQALFGAIANIDSVVGDVTITNQTWGIDTFYTSPVQLTKGTF
ncbi:MAG: Cell wall surface anchor family protein [Parcubacteria group bacterium GW2011_GWA1_40_21]|nr:MAG: Cell wall surface anchor family protein [Parcubacteria group bacterium GW2011_GWA1_40_21]